MFALIEPLAVSWSSQPCARNVALSAFSAAWCQIVRRGTPDDEKDPEDEVGSQRLGEAQFGKDVC